VFILLVIEYSSVYFGLMWHVEDGLKVGFIMSTWNTWCYYIQCSEADKDWSQ